ncbi:MAG: ABC transporter permease, partial [Sphingobacteriales bacterium 12-47-4]
MIRLAIRRLLYGGLVLAGVVMLVFFLFQGIGDPSRLVLGQSGDSLTRENIRKELNLDQPKWKQFLLYMNDISPMAIHDRDEIAKKGLRGLFIGNKTTLAIKWPYLRRSYQSKKEVGTILLQALPGTLMLATAALLIAVLFGIPLGVLSAVKKDTWLDSSAVFTSILGISAPSFFMGILVAYLFGFVWSDFTGLHLT